MSVCVCVCVEGVVIKCVYIERAHWIDLIPTVIFCWEVETHHMTTHGRHLESSSSSEGRKVSSPLIHITRIAHGLPPIARLLGEYLRQ